MYKVGDVLDFHAEYKTLVIVMVDDYGVRFIDPADLQIDIFGKVQTNFATYEELSEVTTIKEDEKPFVVSSRINGISINSEQFLMDEQGKIMKFRTKAIARGYLRDCGLTDDMIESLNIDILKNRI